MIFGRQKKDDVEQRQRFLDGPAYAAYFGLDSINYSGIEIYESTALSVSAVWRAVNLISTTIGQLPLEDLIYNEDGTRDQVRSWINEPGLPLYTRFEFTELMLAHLLLHGNAFLWKIRNGAGAVTGLYPIHPCTVTVEVDLNTFSRTFELSGDNRKLPYTEDDILHIPAFSLDGVRGLSVISVARNSLGTALAGERAAAKAFNNGAAISGIVSPEEEDGLDEEDARIIKESLDAKTSGWQNAGQIAVVNRRLKFTPWTMSMEDAQFLQSRKFQIDEIARWFGLPPYELMEVDKQTSFGTGVEKQQQGVARQVLAPWCARIEQRLSTLLPDNHHAKFNFKALERPTPIEEINTLISQVQGGLITPNEARTVQNRPPMEGGDQLQLPGFDGASADTGGTANDTNTI